MNEAGRIRYSSPAGRWVLGITVLGSSIAFLEATVVNVALPAIGEDLGADVAGLQWIINGYLLTLAALILLGGSLGDRYGRRRIFNIGVIWFAVATVLCAIAPNAEILIAARVVQGIGGALLTPGSLAIIEATFQPEDRGRAIGAWSALGGVAAAIGPLLGGWLIEAVSWRAIFFIDLPIAAFVVWGAARHVPETRDPTITGRLDFPGSALASFALAGLTFTVIQAPEDGLNSPMVLAALVVGLVSAVAFVFVERRSPEPMLPLSIFDSRQFSSANVVTFVVYAAMGGVFFFLVVFLQVSLGYSPIAAGAASLPITALMLAFSPRAGALAMRIGPRLPLTLGPIGIAIGTLMMTLIDPGDSYVGSVLPAVIVFGLGLTLVVAPITATVLAAADERHAGVASGVNNAVARTAGLGGRGAAADRRAHRRRLRGSGRNDRRVPRRRARVRGSRPRRGCSRVADDLQRRAPHRTRERRTRWRRPRSRRDRLQLRGRRDADASGARGALRARGQGELPRVTVGQAGS